MKAGPVSAGSVPLRRLSRAEYEHTLLDLLRVPVEPQELFATEVSGPSGYAEGGPVTSDEVDRMLAAVDTLATRYASSQLQKDLPCKPRDDDDRACAEAFARWFALRAYRHPPSPQELSDLMAVYDDARKDRGLMEALAQVVRAALLSPRFHYRWELGDERPAVKDGLVTLNGYELASRLSYFLWQSMPDEDLFKAAAENRLTDRRAVAAQAERMLRDPKRGAQGVRSFFGAWLPLHELAAHDPNDPNHAVKLSMERSLMAFIEDLILGGGDRRYETLLAADYVFADAQVAGLLGLADVTGSTLQRVALKDRARAGVFTHPAFLAATTDTPLSTIIRRGRFVYERLGSCAAVPPIEGAIPEPPPPPPNASVRQHLAAHAENGTCKACHRFMDPMGFGFARFDALGRLRDTDDYGKPVDTAGTMPLTSEIELGFSDAADLLRQLSKQAASQRCFARQLVGYALRAPADGASEAGIEAVAGAFVDRGGDIAQLLTAVTQSDLFYFRKPSAGEVLR